MIGIRLGGHAATRGAAKRVLVRSLSGYGVRRIDQPGGGVVLHIKTPEGRLIARLKLNQNQWKELTKP